MKKVSLDSLVLDSLEPQVDDIKRKFSAGNKLGMQDMFTLLLKTQYNHLSHLDIKLNETVDRVDGLTIKFGELRQDFKHLEEKTSNNFNNLKQELNSKIDNQTNVFKLEIQKTLNNNTKWIIGILGGLFTLFKVLEFFV